MHDPERKRRQRDARDQQLNDIEQALGDAPTRSKTASGEIKRSQELLQERRLQDVRDDKAEDDASE
jgi:hypothetical protein